MNEKQYLTRTASGFLSAKKREAQRKALEDAPPLPSPPPDDLPVEARLAKWQARAEAAEVRVKQLETLLRQAQHRMVVMEGELKKVSKAVHRALPEKAAV